MLIAFGIYAFISLMILGTVGHIIDRTTVQEFKNNKFQKEYPMEIPNSDIIFVIIFSFLPLFNIVGFIIASMMYLVRLEPYIESKDTSEVTTYKFIYEGKLNKVFRYLKKVFKL